VVVQEGGLVDGGSKIMKTPGMKTDGVHLTLTHTSKLRLAEISRPTTVQKLLMVEVGLHGQEANTALQGMVVAVQVASMEATYSGMMKTTAATLIENMTQFQMETMITILESIFAAGVMEMLMNLCFFLQIGHLPSIVMVELVRRCLECMTLCNFLSILMMKTPAMPIAVLEIIPMVPAIAIMNSISAIIDPVKCLGICLIFFALSILLQAFFWVVFQ